MRPGVAGGSRARARACIMRGHVCACASRVSVCVRIILGVRVVVAGEYQVRSSYWITEQRQGAVPMLWLVCWVGYTDGVDPGAK